IATSDDFWDILFPNVCRPKLVNMSRADNNAEELSWQDRVPRATWRGTDRGAVNWFTGFDLDGLHGTRSLRQIVKDSSSSEFADVKFLEDDLTDSSVAASDPNFIPMDHSARQWRYLLDIPGNGYSGSLKQKLTSDALVLPVQQQIQGIASPLHEHFYAGLQDKRHVLLVECDEDACDVDKKVQFASANDAAARQTVEHANSYMARFDHYSLCYTWRLLQLYSDLLRYPLEDEPRNRNPTVRVHRYAPQHLPTRAEEEAWREACLQDMDNHSV
ncbi:hypothetical protein FOZ63_020359, partial [Perkinsus olseni]